MTDSRGYPRASLLAPVDWLAQRLNHGLQIVDARPVMAQFKVGYPWGHIPGALHLDLGQAFSGSGSGVRGSLGKPGQVAALLGQLGLDPNQTVVVYDDQGGIAAAQAFWLLEYFGFSDVRLLEGGYGAWVLGGYPVSEREPSVPFSKISGTPNPHLLAEKNWLLQNLDDPEVVVVDVRTMGEYAAGHIPGAVHYPWDESLLPGRIPHMKDAPSLKAKLESLGVIPNKTAVVYCQTGVRSAHTYFTLRLLDYPGVRNYDGSWQEWGSLVDTPKAR